MKTIFTYDNKHMKAYELGDAKIIKAATDDFLEGYSYEGMGPESIVKSPHDEGLKKLCYDARGNIYLQEQVDEKYLGSYEESNMGVACSGCDHYYEPSYQYTYKRKLLPRDIMAAFNCLNQTTLYNAQIKKVINSTESGYQRVNILDLERRILSSARRNLDIAIYDHYNNPRNIEVTRLILSGIRVGKGQEYPINSVEDLINVFEKYYHPIQLCIALYGHYNHTFPSVESFFASLHEDGSNPDDTRHKRHIDDVFQTFTLTPQWLNFIDEAQERKESLTRRLY